MAKKAIGVVLFLFLGIFFCKAQDPEFSQIYNNRVYLNPAFAGVDEGHRVALAHRNMWRTLPRHYTTSTASYDFKTCAFPRVGIGVLAMMDSEGDGRLKSTEIGGIFAFHSPYKLGRSSRSSGSFSFAMQASFISRTIDWDKLVFGDQIDPVMGVVRPSSQVNANWQNVNNVDFAAGFLWRQRMYFSKKMDMTIHAGAAIHHLFKPELGLLVNGIMPKRFTLHAGLLIPITKKNYILPGFRFLGQDLTLSNHKEFDLNATYFHSKFFGGFSYRINPVGTYIKNTDAIVFMTGYEFDFSKTSVLRLTYSFDTNFKGVSRGNFFTHEITAVFFQNTKCKGKFGAINKNICDYEDKGLPKIF